MTQKINYVFGSTVTGFVFFDSSINGISEKFFSRDTSEQCFR